MNSKGVWLWAKRVVLWLGLLLCVYAVWRARGVAGDAIARIGLMIWAAVVLMLILCWWLSVMAWRGYVRAYTGRPLDWRIAMRQLGLLLVGKYIPGGVFGFLARLHDDPLAPRERLFWAGLVEQIIGVAMPAVLGSVLYLAARQQAYAWLGLISSLPLLAVGGAWLLHRFATGLQWLGRRVGAIRSPAWRQLLSATTLQLAQQLVWAALVIALTQSLFGLDGYSALGVAGAFWWAVAVGMLAVFAPGGIGVREIALIGLASPWLDMKQAIFLSALLRILSSVMDVGAGVIAASVRGKIERENKP